jgi:uncharacterized membrane protein YcaP (DUF421 family)
MAFIDFLFGAGKDLTLIQMTCRAVAIFLISLVLIRISGRRSFGIRTALDNIIVILLGALLSRAIVGASPFWSVVAASFAIVILHRLFAWLIVRSKSFSRIVEGDKIPLYANNEFISKNMNEALVCQEDVMQGVRKSALTDDMTKIKTVYMERNGEISSLKND